MEAPYCDVVGCNDHARWISIDPPADHCEECLCETHMAYLSQIHLGFAAHYREWTIFLAAEAPGTSTDMRTGVVRHSSPAGRSVRAFSAPHVPDPVGIVQ